MMPSAPSGRRWRSGWRQREADPLLCRFLSCFSTKSLAVCLLEGRHCQTAVLGRQWARERGRERCFWWGAASLSRYWIQIPNSRVSQPQTQAIDKAGWSQCVSPNSLPIWLEKAEDMMLSGHTCLSSMQIKGFGSQSNDTLFFCLILLTTSHQKVLRSTIFARCVQAYWRHWPACQRNSAPDYLKRSVYEHFASEQFQFKFELRYCIELKTQILKNKASRVLLFRCLLQVQWLALWLH